MNADVFTVQRGFHRVGPAGPCIGSADDHAIAPQVAKIPAAPLVTRVTKDPFETLPSEIQGRLIAGSLIHRDACEDSVGKAMSVFGMLFDWLAPPVETVEPAAFGLVPECVP